MSKYESGNDDDSIDALFDFSDLSLDDRVDRGCGDDLASTATSCTTSTSRSEQRKLKRQSKRGSRSKSQHSLEYLRQRVSQLMSIFEEHGWFVPIPESPASAQQNSEDDGNNTKKGKVWSNRMYGADRKRQRKQTERQMLEARIAQLENVLMTEHSMTANDIA